MGRRLKKIGSSPFTEKSGLSKIEENSRGDERGKMHLGVPWWDCERKGTGGRNLKVFPILVSISAAFPSRSLSKKRGVWEDFPEGTRMGGGLPSESGNNTPH